MIHEEYEITVYDRKRGRKFKVYQGINSFTQIELLSEEFSLNGLEILEMRKLRHSENDDEHVESIWDFEPPILP